MAKELSGVRRNPKPKWKRHIPKVWKKARFQKVGFARKGLHPLNRPGFVKFYKHFFSEKHRISFIRD